MKRFIPNMGLAVFREIRRYAVAVGTVVIAGSLIAGTAHANLLLFSFQSGSDSASWEQSSNPSPFDSSMYGIVVLVQNGTETIAGEGTNSFPYVQFNNSAGGGGFETQTLSIITSGPLLFTGTESNPIFSAGIYDLTYFPDHGSNRPGVLTVTDEPAVPEPASLALFCIGLLGLGLVRGVWRGAGIRHGENAA